MLHVTGVCVDSVNTDVWRARPQMSTPYVSAVSPDVTWDTMSNSSDATGKELSYTFPLQLQDSNVQSTPVYLN